MSKKESFGSRFGTIAALGGSVVGLGNIWRFPYLAGENGGAAFLLVYFFVSFLIVVPLMIAEFGIGRRGGHNVFGSLSRLTGSKYWSKVGYFGILVCFFIISFYSVVAGWALDFLCEAVMGSFKGVTAEVMRQRMDGFIADGSGSVAWALLFILATAAIVVLGVKKGIERYTKIMMPMMVLLLIGLSVYSILLPNGAEGVRFLFKPDFGKINGHVILVALGQAFFSLSVGMGTMVTYGAYIKKSENLFKVATAVSLSDFSVAVLSGLVIFPAVFSFGINPTSGPDLIFITLPQIFGQMQGGYVISIVFFFMVFLAAITSSISIFEVLAAFLLQEFNLKRRTAVIWVILALIVSSSATALSMVPGSSLKLFGYNLFDLLNDASSIWMLPLSAFLMTVIAAWVLDKKLFREEITTHGKYGVRLYPYYLFMLKYIVPVTIVLLFLNQIRII